MTCRSSTTDGSRNGELDQDSCPVIDEFTPIPSIGCPTGIGLVIESDTVSVILICQGIEIPCVPT